MHEQRSSLHEVGMAVIRVIGTEGFESLSAALDSLDPDFKRLLVEGAYAEIIARPNLSLKHRELLTVAVLTTMGNANGALEYHAGGMLNTGWTPDALLETILQTLVYAGVPAAINGVRIALHLFAERGLKLADNERGAAGCELDVARLLQREHEQLESLPEEMQALLLQVAYGTALNRSALTIKDRQLATLGIVIAQGSPLSTVRQHLKVCAYVGWTRNELTEVLIQLTGYIGWPLVLAITRTALDVFAEMTDEDFFRAPSTGEAIEPNVVAQTREHGLSAFAVPAYIADISPLVDHYLDDLGIAKTRLQSAEQAKAACLTDIACLTCLARSADTEVLSAHVRQALTLGASNGEIVDAMMKALPHAGVLAVQAALLIANRVIEKTGCFSKETAQYR